MALQADKFAVDLDAVRQPPATDDFGADLETIRSQDADNFGADLARVRTAPPTSVSGVSLGSDRASVRARANETALAGFRLNAEEQMLALNRQHAPVPGPAPVAAPMPVGPRPAPVHAQGFTDPNSVRVTDPRPPTYFNPKTGVQTPFVPFGQGVVEQPALGVVQAVKGVGGLVKAAVTPPAHPVRGAFNPKTGTFADVSATLEPHTLAAANDVVEGIFKAATPLIAVGAVTNPVVTAAALTKAVLADKLGAQAAAVVGASAEGQRLAGNVAALLSGSVSLAEIRATIAADVHAVAEQVRANPALGVSVKVGPAEIPIRRPGGPVAPPAEPTRVGGSMTPAAADAARPLAPIEPQSPAPAPPPAVSPVVPPIAAAPSAPAATPTAPLQPAATPDSPESLAADLAVVRAADVVPVSQENADVSLPIGSPAPLDARQPPGDGQAVGTRQPPQEAAAPRVPETQTPGADAGRPAQETVAPSGAKGEGPVRGAQDLGRPTDVVQTPVISRRVDRQVLDPVIAAVPVDVVNVLGGKKQAAQVLLHQPAVLVDLLASHGDREVGTIVGALRAVVAQRRAELGVSAPAAGRAKYDAALQTFDGHLAELLTAPVSAARRPTFGQEQPIRAAATTEATAPLAGPPPEGQVTAVTDEPGLRHGESLPSKPRVPVAPKRVTMEAPHGSEAAAAPGRPAHQQIETGDPGTRLGSAPVGAAAAGGAAPSPPTRGLSKARQRDADLLDDLVSRARRDGHTGDPVALREALDKRAELVRGINADVDAAGATPDALLRAIAKAGGISERAESGQQGEIAWLKESDLKVRQGGRVFRVNGLSLDGMVEALRQDVRFQHIETINDLVDELTAIAQGTFAGPGALTAQQLGAVGDRWWDRLVPPTDRLDTGEQQPRLPEAGAVRDTDVATPTFDAPFSLTGGEAPSTDVQPSLLDAAAPNKAAVPVQPKRTSAARTPPDEDVSAMPQHALPLPVRPRPAKPAKHQLPVDQIVDALAKLLDGIPVGVGRFTQQALGIYKNQPQVVRTRVADDLQVLAHEFGHHLDIAIMRGSATHVRGPIAQELKTVGAPTSLPSYTAKQRRREGAAEFFRRWLIEPETLTTLAPRYLHEFERFLNTNPVLGTGLAQIRLQIQSYLSLPGVAQARLHLDFQGESAGALQAAARIVQGLRDPEARRDALTYLSSQWVDDLAYLRAAEADMTSDRPIDITQSAVAQARLARRSASKAEGFLHFGVRNDAGEFTGRSFDQAIAPIYARLEDFAVYAAAKRAAVLERRGVVTGFTAAQITDTIARLQSPTFDQALADLRDFHKAKRAYFVEAGMLSSAQAARMDQREPDYVPFQRVRDAVATIFGGGGRGVANRQSPVKRILGSGRRVINPLEMIIRNTHAEVATVEANRAMLALVDLATHTEGSGAWLEEIPEEQAATRFNLHKLSKEIRALLDDQGVDVPDDLDLDELVTVFTPEAFARPNGDRIITVMQAGKRRWFQVHDEGLYDALVAIGPKGTEEIVKLFFAGTQAVRKFATASLSFITRNPVRDIPVAIVQSRAGFLPHDFVKGLFAYLGHSEHYQLYQHAMADMGTLVAADRDLLRKRLRELGHGPARTFLDRTVLHPMEGLQALSHGLETATRLGEFMKTMRRLEQDDIVGRPALMQSALNALDVTIPFGDSGRQVRAWNRYTAFFAARIGGYTRMAQSFTEGGDPRGGWSGGGGRGWRGPAVFLWRALTSISLLSVLLWRLHRDDAEYQELPAWEKNAFWHVPWYHLNGTRAGFIRFPKPFELGQIFGTSVELGLDWLTKKDPMIADRLPDRGTALGLVQSIIPSALLPWVQVASSYDFFQDRYIVQPWQENLAPELQYSRWTSDSAKRLGRWLHVSPARLETLVYGYTGSLGRTTTTAVDALVGGRRPAGGTRVWPVVNAFARPLATSDAASLTELYEARDALRALRSGVAQFRAEGRPERATAEIEKYRDLLPRVNAIEAAARILTAQANPALTAVFTSTSLSPEAKRQALDRIYTGMVNQARQALGRPPLSRDTSDSRAAVPVGAP